MRDYLFHIYQQKYGKVSELQEKLGEDTVKLMENIGYIITSPSKYGDTWHISKRAFHLAKLRYRKSTLWERLCDWINLKIRRIKFN